MIFHLIWKDSFDMQTGSCFGDFESIFIVYFNLRKSNRYSFKLFNGLGQQIEETTDKYTNIPWFVG